MTKLNENELKEFLNEVSKLRKNVENELIQKSNNDFDTWLEFYKDKVHFTYLTDMPNDSLLKNFIIENISPSRYETINVKTVVERIKVNTDIEDMTLEEANIIKNDILKLNFGSVLFDW